MVAPIVCKLVETSSVGLGTSIRLISTAYLGNTNSSIEEADRHGWKDL
jgi:hypothetical protein